MDEANQLAKLSAQLADPARATIVVSLMDGSSRPTGELQIAANVSPSSASMHLSKLVSARILTVVKQGRLKYYRIATAAVAHAIEALSVVALPGRAPYASSKAGLLNLTRVLALEWAAKGVTVNALCPGPFGTDMNKQFLSDPAKYKAFVERIPMGRWGELRDVAGAALFLASDASAFVTGSALFVDGGWTAQ